MVLGTENTPMNTQALYFLQDAPKALNCPQNKKTEHLRRMTIFEGAQISSLFSTRRSSHCPPARAKAEIGAETGSWNTRSNPRFSSCGLSARNGNFVERRKN